MDSERTDTVTSHQCVRPDSGTDDQPWRCPKCGFLWEPLPPTAARPEPARIRINRNAAFIVAAIITGITCLGALAVSPEAFTVAISIVMFACLVWAGWHVSRL